MSCRARRALLISSLAGCLLGPQSVAAHAQERLSISLFGDVGAVARSGPKDIPTYLLSGIDIFARADLTPRIGFVGELFFAGLLRSGEVIDQNASTVGRIDMPRLYARFTVAPWLEIRLGRDFPPQSYFQTAFPGTGLIFQLAVERPRMLTSFAGSDTLTHEIGLFLHGTVDLGNALTVRYAVSTGNGSLNAGRDANRWKSFTGRLSFQPRAVPGLDFGGSVHYDKYPLGVSEQLTIDLPALAFTTYVAYMRHPFEFVAEYLRLHVDEALPGVGHLEMQAFVAQLGYEIGRFTPYARFEILRSELPTLVGPLTSERFAEATELLVGVRLRLHEKFVLKLQYGREFDRGLHSGAFQAAFAY